MIKNRRCKKKNLLSTVLIIKDLNAYTVPETEDFSSLDNNTKSQSNACTDIKT